MKLWDVVAKVGSAALNVACPGAGTALVGVVNGFLDPEKQLPADATGHDVQNAVQTLPPEVRAKVMDHEFEIEKLEIVESHSTVRAMLDSDAKNPHSTRPYIAKHAFHVIAFALVVTVTLWAWGIVKADAEVIKAVTEGWPFILAVIGPLVTLLLAYFGILKKEHKQRLEAANGAPPTGGIAGLLTGLLNAKMVK